MTPPLAGISKVRMLGPPRFSALSTLSDTAALAMMLLTARPQTGG